MQPSTSLIASAPLFCKIDRTHQARLIGEVAAILREEESHKAAIFDESFWSWQYLDLPTKKANVYAALVDEQIKGYYHVPLYRGRVNGQPKLFASVQDVAIKKEMRGGGVFRQLAEFATADLERAGVDLIYTFPNHKSIRTFLKYNAYAQIATFKMYVLPVRSGDLLHTRFKLAGMEKIAGFGVDKLLRFFSVAAEPDLKVQQHPAIDQSISTVFAAYQKAHVVAVERDAAYLRWRYEQRPHSKHVIYSIARDGMPLLAAAIFKYDEMFDNPALLLMDFAFVPDGEKYLLQLIQEVKERGQQSDTDRFHLIFATGNNRFFQQLTKIGFISVPEKFNPRPLNLLVKNISSQDAATPLQANHWHVTLGDWDVF